MSRRSKSSKAFEWIYRYFPAELTGTLFALAGAMLIHAQTGSFALAAIAGTLSENVGFYGHFLVRDGVRNYALLSDMYGLRRILTALATTCRNLIVEFGVAEALDSLLLRPFFMFLIPQLIPNFTAGIIVGKLCADAVFYSIAILGYELRKYLFPKRRGASQGEPQTIQVTTNEEQQ